VPFLRGNGSLATSCGPAAGIWRCTATSRVAGRC